MSCSVNHGLGRDGKPFGHGTGEFCQAGNLLDARRRADDQALDLRDALERFLKTERPAVPDDEEANELRGLEDDLENALSRVKRARMDIEILSKL